MFDKNSSSFHVINSDFPLSFFRKLLYLFLNSCVTLIPFKTRNLESFTKFRPRESVLLGVRMLERGPITPARFLSNAFWDSLNYNNLKDSLNGSLRVLEVGCGTGRYGKRIAGLAEIESYDGLDLQYHSEWHQEEMSLLNFHQDTYLNISQYLTNQNLIITQSALEHFESDIFLLRKISAYAAASNSPIISIHLFPGAASLHTYLWHGIRQYGPLQLARLVKANGEYSSNYVFSLGGRKINFFHFIHITIPEITRKPGLLSEEVNSYFDLLMTALKKDSASQSKSFPAFTALITTWNLPKVDIDYLVQ